MSPGGILSVAWGRPYACDIDRPSYDVPEVGHVWMFRKGQRVRFFDRHGDQVGPEQSNVAPAIAYSMRERWIPSRLIAVARVAESAR